MVLCFLADDPVKRNPEKHEATALRDHWPGYSLLESHRTCVGGAFTVIWAKKEKTGAQTHKKSRGPCKTARQEKRRRFLDATGQQD